MLCRMLRVLLGLIIASLSLAPMGAQAQLDGMRRAALVIGNSDYQVDPRLADLPNPVNDARAMNSVLQELGFDVLMVEDADRGTIAQTVTQMAGAFPQGGIGLFYYAGHAVQYQGVNYLLPTDFRLTSAEDLPRTAIALNDLLKGLDRAGVKIAIVILDACRENPFGEVSGAFGEGLALVDAPGETLIAYATNPGGVAEDGVGANSPYTGALVAALELPGQDIYDVFRLVRAKVREATNNRQIPWFLASLETQFWFREAETLTAQPPLSLPDERITLASVQWHTIQQSVDPTDFERFLLVHAETPYASLAQRRLDELKRAGREPLPEVTILPAQAPAVAGAAGRVTECDVMAADPYDWKRVSAGVPWGLVNTRIAIRACLRSLAQEPGNPRLMFQLGRALDIAERFDEAQELYRQASEREYSAAFGNLGYMYRTGRGVARDDAQAARYYREAASRGDPAGQTSLAALYSHGWGVPQSYDEALSWYRIAAKLDWPGALDSLGNIYLKGLGVPPDPAQAVRYYQDAARLGHSNAMNNLGTAYLKGLGVAEDPKQAASWYVRAMEEGNPYAPWYLGRMFREKWGVERDYRLALKYFQISADRGFNEAYYHLGQMYENGEGTPRDLEQAYYHYWVAREAGRFHGNQNSLRMADAAQARLAAIEGEMGGEAVQRARTRAQDWLDQNGLLQFRLVNTW